MKMLKRLEKVRKNNKGFTLVELIVVLVILAILAAILVPALLGYIDRAKESQYELEAKAVLTAMQGEASRMYATAAPGTSISKKSFYDKDGNLNTYGTLVESTADVSNLVITKVTTQTPPANPTATQTLHAGYTIVGVDITFDSANGNTVQCVLANNIWTCTVQP